MKSRGFGQRAAITRESLRAIQGIPDDEGGGAGAGSPQLRQMAVWIGAVAVLIGIYLAIANGSGQELKKYWKTETPALAAAYVPVGAKDVLLEQVNNTCKSRGDAAGGNAIQQAVAYVSCLATESPKRLCQMTHRTHLLTAMKNYYHLQAKSSDLPIGSHPQMIEALKTVVVHGYMPRRDVAAAGPADLEAALRGVEARKSGC